MWHIASWHMAEKSRNISMFLKEELKLQKQNGTIENKGALEGFMFLIHYQTCCIP